MRLPPLPADQWDEQVQRALSGLLPRDRQNPAGAGNALATLVRHPDLTKAYLSLGVHLLFRSTLPARVRELAILRVAHRRGCAYEWAHHVEMAGESGVTAADIAAARGGTPTDEFDRVVFDATDELDTTSNLSDATWAALGAHLDERQCMDLVFTVGGYGMLAMAFNTFGVEVEQTER
ncbi:carboxymuconolactone decarboxylase family protein [Nocardia sp. XZ_19_231]|uniref:carboxymuconolactone decarboxylase family protein n=1 Tax=Nocardia sp. XZ_19_231 TaxID=2769252 RepID=UPI00188E751A|nr:carboxymuconolactone decarboxylase family protein [Nocardia sp. XZ_19_231]